MPSVEIYTKTTCPYCWRAKQLLTSKGIAYKEVVVDFGGPEKQAMIERANGRRTVPQIFIGERHIGGCDDLVMLEQDGKLDALIVA